jgi:hypothetical protein
MKSRGYEVNMSFLIERYKELKAAGETFFGKFGTWSYETWLELNKTFFDETLKPGPIVWGLTAYGHYLGSYSLGGRNTITLHTSLISPSTSAPWKISYLGKRFASDVLLHEMMHQHLYQKKPNGYADETDHNNEAWCSEVNRIGELLGLDMPKAKVVKQKRVKGKVVWYVEPGCMSRKDCASFPHPQRPRGYYEKHIPISTLAKVAIIEDEH